MTQVSLSQPNVLLRCFNQQKTHVMTQLVISGDKIMLNNIFSVLKVKKNRQFHPKPKKITSLNILFSLRNVALRLSNDINDLKVLNDLNNNSDSQRPLIRV